MRDRFRMAMTDLAQWANDNRPEGSIAAAFGLFSISIAQWAKLAGFRVRVYGLEPPGFPESS